MHDASFDFLLPRPRRLRTLGGQFELSEYSRVYILSAFNQAELDVAAEITCNGMETEGRWFAVGERLTDSDKPRSMVELTEAAAKLSGPDSYRLIITQEKASVEGASRAGLYYGMHTLAQIARIFGTRWPCVEIEDAPDFAVRGLMLDVSRGKVPTLDTLKRLADRMAALKLNQLQLYVEHTFDFAFDRSIGDGSSPLTADEIRMLDSYCRERYIELVPCLALFGHMGRILSLPQYRQLAEIEATKSWEQMDWFERGRGFTLDSSNAESRRLIEQMVDEYLPFFSGPYFNVCADETYDLGKGKTKANAESRGIGRLYLDHLEFLHSLAARHGKRMMFWGDIMRKCPELIPQIPKDAIVLNWGYEADFDFDSTAAFTQAGLETYVCPATWGFSRLTCAINIAEANIRGHAAAGQRHGASGLLNTHWGDQGHFNTLADARHPIALGADAAWNAATETSAQASRRRFDRAFSLHFFGDPNASLIRPLRRLASATNMHATWRLLHGTFDGTQTPDDLPSDDETRQIDLAAREALVALEEYAAADRLGEDDLAELQVVYRTIALLPEKIWLAREHRRSESLRPDQLTGTAFAERCEQFAAGVEQLIPLVVTAWNLRNKPSSLTDVVVALERLARMARDLPATPRAG